MSSCQLQQFASIKDANEVCQYLFCDFGNSESVADNDDDWNSDEWAENWDFDKVKNPQAKDSEKSQDEKSWINSCCFSFSPAADFLCFAHKDKAVLLSNEVSRRSSDQSGVVLDICFKGTLAEIEGESITAVLCLPLASLSRTSPGNRDWTCTLIGFSSGYIRMYSETGGLLISELLHESPVVQLGCRTHDTSFNSVCNSSAEHRDELTILYGESLVSIEGFSLFQTLRACRNQLAVATARGASSIDPPPLSYKKWVLRGHDVIGSHLHVGRTSLSHFDKMHDACILEGYKAEIKSGSNVMLEYVTAGSGPFVGFFHAVEGSTQPFFSHVAFAVASSLKSALYNAASGWLSWGQKPQTDDVVKLKAKPKVEVGTGLDIRCGLPDAMRYAHEIILAPGVNWLAATADSFGRVMLLDIVKTRTLRMWKGYRDAQIGFIQTNEYVNDSPKSSSFLGNAKRRMALFLVIYAPRRGILEVWSCINGPRVGTFNIGKNSKLIYPGYGMFGLHNRKEGYSGDAFTMQCCLLESNGDLKQIFVPFHLALSDSNSNKARDIHLLKSISQLLQNCSKDGNEVTKLLTSMRLPSVQMQAIKKLLHSNHITSDILKQCFEEILLQFNRPELKKEEKELVEFVKAQNSLVDLYLLIEKLGTSAEKRSSQNLKETTPDGLSKEIIVTAGEAAKVIEITSEFQNVICSSKDKELRTPTVSEFLRCFNVNLTEINKHSLAKNSSVNRNSISSDRFVMALKSDIQSITTCLISTTIVHYADYCLFASPVVNRSAKYIFYLPLFEDLSANDVIETIKSNITLSDKEILLLVFECFMDNEQLIAKDPVTCVNRLKICLKILTNINQDSSDDAISNLGKWIKDEICHPSKSVLSAYFIVLSCRAVDVARRSDKTDVDSKENLEGADESAPPSYEEATNDFNVSSHSSGWETLWPELELWNLLIKQFEDCLFINTALYKANQDIPKTKDSEEDEVKRVSVYDLLHNGSGYIPELISKKLSLLKVSPGSVLRDASSDEDEKTSEEEGQQFLNYLKSNLSVRFPKLLSSNSVHAHCFWHEMVLWNRNAESIEHMERALDHIRLVKCDPHIQHGLALMAWRTFVTKRFISLAKLVDKVGKAPKDRLCRKETDMSVRVMPMFCHCCTQLLQAIADADPDQYPKPSMEIDQVYKKANNISDADDTWSEVPGKVSITEIGRDQPTANYALVQLTMHLSFILDGVMEFTLRGVKPLTQMFDSNNRNNFLVDLTDGRVVVSRFSVVDSDIGKHRKQFLCKVVRAAVSRMYAQQEDDEVIKSMKEWVETSIHMAAQFQLDDSQINVHYICQLFKFGLDSMAYDLMKTCGSEKELASHLMIIVGQRLHYLLLMASPEDGIIILSQMSTTRSSWVKAQDSKELDIADIDARSTLFLAREILTLCTEEHEQFALAQFLVEALSIIVNS